MQQALVVEGLAVGQGLVDWFHVFKKTSLFYLLVIKNFLEEFVIFQLQKHIKRLHLCTVILLFLEI